MTMPTDRVIDKVRKLLAGANSSATGHGVEHEQETAMRQALAMLANHNLSMADIAIEDKEDRDSAEITEEFPCPWRRILAGAIAGLFFCEFFKSQVPDKQKYKFVFVGLESNATTAKEMTQYLIKSVLKESIRRQKEQNETVAFGTSFRNAAAARISMRCVEMRKEAEHKQGESGALVLASFYDAEMIANNKYIEQIMGVKLRTRKNGKNQKLEGSGLVQGYQYGATVGLSRQVSAPSALRLQ